MELSPSREAFAAAYEAGTPQLVWTRLPDDIETPVAAALKLGRNAPYSFLLESVERGNWRGRYSAIGLAPDLVWRVRDGQAERAEGEAVAAGRFTPETRPARESLKALLAESALAIPASLPPLAAGLFGYLGYDMVRQVERLGPGPADRLGTPDAILMRPTAVVVFDALAQDIALATPARPQPGLQAEAAFEAALGRLRALADGLAAPLTGAKPFAAPIRPIAPEPSRTAPAFRAMVEKAKALIRAGDIFQVVASLLYSSPFELPPFALYRALRRLNPSPFLFHLGFPDFAVVGSSPEILVRLREGKVTLRPIAGTRPRGATPEEDAAHEAALLADPKERAEHLMLLDLGRNDVGRVAEPGQVTVTERFAVERYSHVMHLVSHVEGRIKAGLDAADALFAGFPAGTVSGAPKVRAMEVIDMLEGERRGLFYGAVGYFSANGEMDTCIALRTALVKDGMMHVRAGGGVVFDSDPETERQETLHKARALFRAASEAARYV